MSSWIFEYDGTRVTRDTNLVKQYFLNCKGIYVLDGIPYEPADAPFAKREEGYFMVSFMNIGIGYKIDHLSYPSFEWYTERVPEEIEDKDVIFIFCFACGNGAPYPQCTGWYDLSINGKKVLSFRSPKYDQIFESKEDEVRLALRVAKISFAEEDESIHIDPYTYGDSWASFGSAALKVPRSMLIPGQPVKLKIESRSFFPSKEWFRIDMLGRRWTGRIFEEINTEKTINLLESKRKIPFLNESNVYFGDIHVHSDCGRRSACGYNSSEEVNKRDCINCNLSAGGNGCGYGTISHNYFYAKYISNLDFFCLTDHDFQTYDDRDWKKRVEIAKFSSEPGTFIAIPGYEFTSFPIGHRNIYFGSYENTTMIPSRIYNVDGMRIETQESFNPKLLWEKLEKSGCPFITVPHHPPVICHAFNWDTFDPKYDRLVEVFSGWGDHWFAEGFLKGDGSDKEPGLSVKKAFENGLFFGMIASSDAHDGCPGSSQGSGLYNWANKFSRVGSGLAAVKIDTLSLEDIFGALYNKQCYATTGIHALVDFKINDIGMGKEILTQNEEVTIKVSVRAPIEITKIRIYRGNKLIDRIFSDEKEEEIELEDKLAYGETAQYVAIVDFMGYERAWSSPIHITRR